MKSEEELLNGIKSQMEDLEITISDLKSPTPRFVQNYFSRLVMDFGMDPSRNISKSQEKYDEFTALNSVKPVLPLFGLFAAVQHLGRFCDDFDFRLSDLTHPDPQRTQHLLRKCVWFYDFADYKAQQAQDERQKRLREKKRLELLKAEVEKTKETIANENEEYSLIGVLKKEMEEDDNMIEQLKKQRHEEEEEIAEISVEVEKLNARHSKLISKQTKLEDQLKHIQSQLVLSAEIDNLESKLKDAKEKNEDNQKKKQHLRDLITSKSQQCTMIETCLPAVKQSKENLQTLFECLKKDDDLHMIVKQKEAAELHIEKVNFRIRENEEEIQKLVELNNKTSDKIDAFFKEKIDKVRLSETLHI
ncbi:hypothetical protein C0J52_12559 [Blattella germanica]|nr:hypothetical protein C0J52_12559 [Blattella germanica]